MPAFVPVVAYRAQVDFSPVVNGQLIIAVDTGEIFFDYNRQSHIINKDCLCLIEEINEIKEIGLDSLILDCRYSNEKYTSQILSIYNEGLKGKDQSF